MLRTFPHICRISISGPPFSRPVLSSFPSSAWERISAKLFFAFERPSIVDTAALEAESRRAGRRSQAERRRTFFTFDKSVAIFLRGARWFGWSMLSSDWCDRFAVADLWGSLGLLGKAGRQSEDPHQVVSQGMPQSDHFCLGRATNREVLQAVVAGLGVDAFDRSGPLAI